MNFILFFFYFFIRCQNIYTFTSWQCLRSILSRQLSHFWVVIPTLRLVLISLMWQSHDFGAACLHRRGLPWLVWHYCVCFAGEESISVEMAWDGLGLSSALAPGRSNFSSSALFVSELNSINSSHSGGSFFGIFPENGSTSTPHTLPQPRVRDVGLARAEIAVLGVVLALTTLGNSFVLWVLLRRRKHNAPMHVFMVNLCVADLVVAFFQVSLLAFWGTVFLHQSKRWNNH